MDLASAPPSLYPCSSPTYKQTAVKEKLQKYSATTYARSGVNQMWILKNSKELLANLKAQTSQINSIKTYDFSTLYSTIPHDKLKSRLLDNCFVNKNGEKKYSYLVISHQKHYFVKYHSDSTQKYYDVAIKKMLEFLIDDIDIVVGGQVFRRSVGIPMGTNCAPLLADLFLYSYEAEFIQKLLHKKKKISCCGLRFDILIYWRHFIY
jgi:hypothetical protein